MPTINDRINIVLKHLIGTFINHLHKSIRQGRFVYVEHFNKRAILKVLNHGSE